MRARPEPAQLEHLSDVSFLVKLLVFPANVRLDWKVIARYKHSTLFGLVGSDAENRSITLTPDILCLHRKNTTVLERGRKLFQNEIIGTKSSFELKHFLLNLILHFVLLRRNRSFKGSRTKLSLKL